MFDRTFFSRIESPINLAIFRIGFFSVIPFQINWNYGLAVSTLPKELRVPPVGLDWLVPYLPINNELTIGSGVLLIMASISAAIGFYSRTSAFLAALFSFYFFGIQYFFGDVSHYHHHIVWFSLILALSPCGDALSIDSRKKTIPAPANRYSLPLRYIWILFGIAYFFPGYWKLRHSGLDWAFSDNLKYQMYQKWTQLDWHPFFAIDQYPFFYKSGALMTLVFEIGFIVFLFFPFLRKIFIGLGILFHLMIALFLKIYFWSFLVCYIVFFDWSRLFKTPIQTVDQKKGSHPFLTVVFVIMCALNLSFGFLGIREAWPFASFPDFKHINGPQYAFYSLAFVDENKMPIEEEADAMSLFPLKGKKIRNLIQYTLKHQDEMRKQEILRSVAKSCLVCKSKYVQVYKVTHWVEPERLAENPVKKKLIYEVPL